MQHSGAAAAAAMSLGDATQIGGDKKYLHAEINNELVR